MKSSAFKWALKSRFLLALCCTTLLLSCTRKAPEADSNDANIGNGSVSAQTGQEATSLAWVSIANPNPLNHTGTARAPSEVEAERELARKFCERIPDYVRQNGLRKTISEINRGRAGELGAYMPDSHFYLSFSINRGSPLHWQIIAHPTLPAAIGYDIPDLSMVKDNTGWAYNAELLEKIGNAEHGQIENIVWTDPEWSKLSCRMAAYNAIFSHENSRFTAYFAIWLDY